MLRTATSNLLIAIVLVCPQVCLGEAADAMGAPCEAGHCVCAEHGDQSGGETPRPSEGNEPDCLCRGAIMDGERSSKEDTIAPLAVAWLIDGAILSRSAPSLTVALSEPPLPFPPMATGRDVCVLICALLL